MARRVRHCEWCGRKTRARRHRCADCDKLLCGICWFLRKCPRCYHEEWERYKVHRKRYWEEAGKPQIAANGDFEPETFEAFMKRTKLPPEVSNV